MKYEQVQEEAKQEIHRHRGQIERQFGARAQSRSRSAQPVQTVGARAQEISEARRDYRRCCRRGGVFGGAGFYCDE